MNSNFYKVVKRLFDEQKRFYFVVANTIEPCKIKGLSGDYVILDTKIDAKDVLVHMHYTQLQLLSPD